MYAIKSYYDSTAELDGILSSNMYTMPNANPVNAAASNVASADSIAHAALEQRQQKLLQQLEDIANKLHLMHAAVDRSPNSPAEQSPIRTVGAAKPDTDTTPSNSEPYSVLQALHRTKYGITAVKPIQPAQLGEIVINADPRRHVPYGLRAIKTLWQDRIHVEVLPYKHSSLQNVALPDDVRQFEQLLAYTRPATTPLPTLTVRLIWKDCRHTELVSGYLPIVGEANIVRYLYRCGPPELQSPDYPLAELFVPDMALDLVHALTVVATSQSERRPIWLQLDKLLQSSPFFGRDLICAADLAVASAVRQLGGVGGDDVPKKLRAIWEAVKELTEFRTKQ